jgi:hypothetical protein
MSVSSYLETFFRQRLDRFSAKSATGSQLDGLRNETTGIRGANPHALEERAIRYAMMVKIWASLTREEQAVLFLQHAPTGPVEYVEALRAVWPDELGEEDDAVRTLAGKVIVACTELRQRTHAQIASLLGITPSQVRTRVRTANKRLGAHPLMEAL